MANPKKAKRIFDKNINRYGQSTILHKASKGQRCPCFNQNTGYCNPQWHRDNPKAPECDEEGYIDAGFEDIEVKAFILPKSDLDRKVINEAVLSQIGILDKDDYMYIGKTDIDILNLSNTDYLIYENKRWQILSPDTYKLGDISIVYVARLKPLGSDLYE
ncbi:hypothetical protein [Tepidibacter hydrothermalis]|uniref:Phage protein n=1 Tax=Tepidibacter hydrothermalis TaxID=3036126 RepID=A0ABY8EKJ8_9FIRM|nr:hypothetical protein [Tepidibacter hydrothermalis]WFD12462.1 hypothetical protein P4S50_19985 [Tepidibacter hydrothermalis]